MSGTPRTWFSGKSSPEDHKGIDGTTYAAIAFFVLSPIGALTSIAGYVAFTVFRYSWKVVGGTTAIYAALFLVFGGLRPGFLRRYFSPWTDLLNAVFGPKGHPGLGETVAHQWPHWLLAQAGLSLLLGGLFATALTAYKWVRRAEWDIDGNRRRPGPYEVWRLKKNVAAIANATIDPKDGHTIGTNETGKLIVQTVAEGSAHTLVAGGSGSGKTTTMLSMIRDDIRKGEAVIFVDLKGATDVPEQLAEWSARYGRKFMHWTIQDKRAPYKGPAEGPAFYDPIGRGDPSRRKDLLIESQKWDVEYYKTVIANYLQTAFTLADRVPDPNADSFTDLAALLDTKKLSLRAGHLLRHSPLTVEAQQALYGQPADYKWWEWIGHVLDPEIVTLLSAVDATVNGMEESERSGIRNMSARIQVLTNSVAGDWLKKDPTGQRDINLRNVAHEGWVVVFTLDSANYAQTARQIGGLIIQDIQTLSSELRHEPARTPTHLYIDEFSAVGSDNVLGLLARARDAKIPVTLSTQALADLKKADDDFLDQCMGIVNCFIVHRANQEHDAEVLAGLTGKHKVMKTQYGIEMTSGMPGGMTAGAATGSGFVREEEEYVIPPSKIQSLKTGELVYIANSPNRRFEFVKVTPEDPMAVVTAGVPHVGRVSTNTVPDSALVILPDGIEDHAPAVREQAPFSAVPPTGSGVPATGTVAVPWGTEPQAPAGRKRSSNALDMAQDALEDTPIGPLNGQEAASPVQFDPQADLAPSPFTAAEPASDDAPVKPYRPSGPPLINPDQFRSRVPSPNPAQQAAPAPVVARPVIDASLPAALPTQMAVPAQVDTPPPTLAAAPAASLAPVVTPAPPAAAAIAPAGVTQSAAVTPASPSAGTGGIPVVRPAVLSAPWLNGQDTDELGMPMPTAATPVIDDPDETGSAFATTGLPDTWGDGVAETGAIHLRRADVSADPPAQEVTAAPVSNPGNLPTKATGAAPLFPDFPDTDWSTR